MSPKLVWPVRRVESNIKKLRVVGAPRQAAVRLRQRVSEQLARGQVEQPDGVGLVAGGVSGVGEESVAGGGPQIAGREESVWFG